ncbi:MAG: recombinase family protein, partial [Actinomycetota bacterium]
VKVDPERGPLITWAFEQYATGNWSQHQLLDALTAKGLTTVPTRAWPAHPLHLSHLQRILKNPYYMGIVTYRGEQYPDIHEPLVSPETFAKVQQQIAANYTAGERTREHPHFLKGTVFCDQCGARMCITKANGHGGTYFYFFCLGKQRLRRCQQKYLRVEEIEELVARQYGKISFTAERAGIITSELEAYLSNRQAKREKEAARQERRLARLKADSLKLLQRSYRDLIPEEVFIKEQTRINREIAVADAAINQARASVDSIARVGQRAATLLANCEDAYRVAPDKIKRQWNQAFFARVLIGAGGKARIELAQPIAEMLKFDFARQGEAARDEAEIEALAAQVDAIFQDADEPALISLGAGSSKNYLVGATGIEPVTSRV